MQQFGVLSLGSRLKRLSDHLYNEVQEIYQAKSLAISSTYFPILRLLQGEQGLSVVDISEHLGLSHPAVSKQVSKMLKEGLLVKKPDPNDQRRSTIALSAFCDAEMAKVEPVLVAIASELEFYLNQLSGDFLTQLSHLENQLLTQHYAARVLLRLTPDAMVVEELASKADAERFKALNMRWLNQWFEGQVYPQDYQMLNEPFQEMACGAIIKVARFRNQVIGCYLLKSPEGGDMELCKLAVDDGFIRLGVGERLMQDAIKEALRLSIKRLTLETHSSLKPAIALYRRLGFVAVDTQAFSVPRADTKMALVLDKGGRA